MLNIQGITPAAFRLLNREGTRFLESTSGFCPGYLQLNMAVLSKEHALDFEEFCRRNSSACPLVYKSEVGEVEAPQLAAQSDIRTDLPAYKVYTHGVHTDTLPNITAHPWQSMVSFYFGCSFSFEKILNENGINANNFGIYTTNIKCHPVGIFAPNLVVSMKGISKGLISIAVKATINVDYAHGAPIHIGRPEDIGILNLEESEWGYASKLDNDEVPVFWACGVTSSLALQSGKLPICFSHSPSCMFVTDVLSEDVPTMINTTLYPKPITICLDDVNSRYSILSEHCWEVLNTIGKEISDDPGQRGICHLMVESDYNKACLSLSKRSGHVGIALGFPCLEKFDPCEENDGVAGAVYLAKALMCLGNDVTFIVDSHSTILKKTLLDCFPKGFLGREPRVLSVSPNFSIEDTSLIFDETKKQAVFSHLISIERPSPSDNGKCHTMTGRDISDRCDPISILFEQAKTLNDVITIGIGDGGNEIGMGKVQKKVKQYIPNGDVIAASTSCDYLITCGVSNWGGIAVACGLFAVRNCVVHDRFQRNGMGFKDNQLDINRFVVTDAEDEELHKYITKQGFRDGISAEQVLTVDNLDYYDTHVPKLRKCRELATK